MNGLARPIAVALLTAAGLGGCGSYRSTADFRAAEQRAVLALPAMAASRAAVEVGSGDGVQPPATPAKVVQPLPGSKTVPPPPVAGGPGGPPAPAGHRDATAAVATGSGPDRRPGAVVAAAGAAPVQPTGAPSPESPVAARPGTRSEVVLGSFGTSSGPIGAAVATIPVAVRAWAATVNAAGGLDGHPVRVVFGDDGGDPGKALALARRMVEQDHAVAFVGTHGPTTLQAVVPYAEEHRIPIVGGTTSLAVEDQSPMVFNPQVGLFGSGRGFVTTLTHQSPARKASVIYCREAPGCAASHDAIVSYAGQAGVQIVHQAQVSLAQPDFTAEVVAARQAGAEAVIGVVDVASMLRYMRSAQRQGWKPVFSGSFAFDTVDAERAGPDAEGLLAFAGTADFDGSPKMADYRAAVGRVEPGGATGGPGAHAWAQGRLLEAAGRHLPDTVTSAAILTGLWALRGETLGGIVPPLTFPDGPHRDVNRCIVPIRLAGGHWTQPLGDRFVCA